MRQYDHRPQFVSIAKANVKRTRAPKATPARREAFLRQAESAVRASLLNGITRFKQRVPKDKLDEMYRQRRYDDLHTVLPWQHVEDALAHGDKLIEQGRIRAGQHQIDAIASEEASDAHALDFTANAVLRSRPGRANQLKQMLPNVKGDARQHIKNVVAEAAKTGATPRAVADRIVEGLALNKQQSKALANFRRDLEAKGTHKPSVIERRVKAYHDRLQRQRADMIAVTETRVAAGATELTAWRTQANVGLIEPTAKQEWLAEPDACDEICKPMANKTIGLHELWILPDGRTIDTPAQSHPRCRCNAALLDF